MRIAYNILFVVFFWLSAPYYFVKMWRRGNWRAGMGQRFGRYTPEFKAALAGGPVLWLHAVSVGETGVCLQLLGQLEPRLPGWRFAVSTTTSTGMGELQRRLPPHIARFYYPANLSGVVRRALDAIQPRALILVESELWPNLLWQIQDRGTPVFLVNARVSDRSLRGYRRFGFLFRPIFAKFRGVGCQSPGEAARLAELGFPAADLRVTGNLKFDAAAPGAPSGPDVPGLLRQIGVNNKARLLVAGSTHAGEESLLAEMLPRLRRRFPDLFLVLVPRHFERAGSVGQELEARGVTFIRRSDTGGAGQGDGLRAEHAEFHFRRPVPPGGPGRNPGADGGGTGADPRATAGRRRPARQPGRARPASGAGQPGRHPAHGGYDFASRRGRFSRRACSFTPPRPPERGLARRKRDLESLAALGARLSRSHPSASSPAESHERVSSWYCHIFVERDRFEKVRFVGLYYFCASFGWTVKGVAPGFVHSARLRRNCDA